MKKAEIVFYFLVVSALILNLFSIPGGKILTTLTFGILSGFYFLFGIAFFNNVPLRKMFKLESYEGKGLRVLGGFATGYALSLTLLGILFKISMFPGANMILLAGLIVMIIILIVGLMKYRKIRDAYYIVIFKRLCLIGIAGFVVLLLPETFWVNIRTSMLTA